VHITLAATVGHLLAQSGRATHLSAVNSHAGVCLLEFLAGLHVGS